MILKKEFYFVRHGQTDHNKQAAKTDHEDISLNQTGVEQARSLSPLIHGLSLGTICCSPMKRAKETKELLAPHFLSLEIADLGECTARIWHEMVSLGPQAHFQGSAIVKSFFEQVKRGVNRALENEGPVLIVAHGGVYWVLCSWMEIEEHSWLIDNCQPVHFSWSDSGKWKAKLL